jgi:hypothetical protein
VPKVSVTNFAVLLSVGCGLPPQPMAVGLAILPPHPMAVGCQHILYYSFSKYAGTNTSKQFFTLFLQTYFNHHPQMTN